MTKPLEGEHKEIDEALYYWNKRKELTVVDHPFPVPYLRQYNDKTYSIPSPEERFKEARVPLNTFQLIDHRALELLANKWLEARNPDHMWWVTKGQTGSKCTIDEHGMAVLAYKDQRLQVQANVCFWGRNPNDRRIISQLDIVATSLADTHANLLKGRRHP